MAGHENLIQRKIKEYFYPYLVHNARCLWGDGEGKNARPDDMISWDDVWATVAEKIDNDDFNPGKSEDFYQKAFVDRRNVNKTEFALLFPGFPEAKEPKTRVFREMGLSGLRSVSTWATNHEFDDAVDEINNSTQNSDSSVGTIGSLNTDINCFIPLEDQQGPISFDQLLGLGFNDQDIRSGDAGDYIE